MKVLSKSSSSPGIAPAVALGLAAGTSASPLLEGTLYVAKPASSQGLASWEPYRFVHHAEGSLSFRPLKGRVQKLPSDKVDGLSYGRLSGGARDEFFLDADWRQPFMAAPWKPVLHPGASPKLQLPDATKQDASGGELFPFTLSYAPARLKPEDAGSATSRRRTVVLAASTARARSKWLATFARKAHAPELRGGSSVSALGANSGTSGRRIAALGEEHTGLPGEIMRGKSMPRLVAGHPTLFDSRSSLRIVRDLYDGYAADPLSQNSRGQQRSSSDSDSSGTGPPSTTRKSRFLARYLGKQAQIEQLLDHNWSAVSAPTDSRPSSSPALASTSGINHKPSPHTLRGQLGGTAEGATANSLASSSADADGSDLYTLFPNRVKLADKTPNVSLKGNVISNSQWSGGAIFTPPNERSFRLTVIPVHDLEAYPIFIGLAPPNADLSMVSFFSSGGGVFLCAGGRPSDDLISALGAPGGPAFFCFGERNFSDLPNPTPGQSISVHYTENRHGGQVRFILNSEDGEEFLSDRPPLLQALPVGGWRPCLLLSMPDTRVHIVSLI